MTAIKALSETNHLIAVFPTAPPTKCRPNLSATLLELRLDLQVRREFPQLPVRHGAEPASAFLTQGRGIYLGDRLPEFCNQERLLRFLNLFELRKAFRL